MKTEDIDPEKFFRAPDAVAIVAAPADLFGLLNRTYDLAPDLAALVVGEHGERKVCPPGTKVDADGAVEILIVRTVPLAVTWDNLTARSIDHYQCSARITLRVSLVPDASELNGFRRNVIGTSRVARVSTVAQYLLDPVKQALSVIAEGRGVEVLIDSGTSEAVAAELAEALKGPAFSAGMKIERPITVQFDSPVYRQVRRTREESRRKREALSADRRIEMAAEEAQRQHAEHLATLLADLRNQADSAPGVDLAEVLRTFPEADRGSLYTALLCTGENDEETESIVVASGGELLWFAPRSSDTPLRRMPVPDSVGAVRSVQIQIDASNQRLLLVGAARGVHELVSGGGGEPIVYRAQTDADVRGGINAVTLAGDNIIASHSELGLLCWKRGSDAPADQLQIERTRDAQAVRCVQFFNGDVYFSADACVYKLRADDPAGSPTAFTGSRSLITSICPTRDVLYAGNAHGDILYWAGNAADAPEILHAGRDRSAESVTLTDSGGLERLYYTDTSTAVFARVVGDSFSCRYEAGGQTLRRVEVARDVVVATNDARDRLICWSPGDAARPYAVIGVSRITGHSIQDVCLIPAL